MARRHPNVLKVQRQRRKGRRAYLTSVYSLIKVPRSISVSNIPEDAKALFAYRERGKGFYDAYLEAIFPGRKVPPSDWKSEAPDKYQALDKDGLPIHTNVGEHNGRKYALERADEERLLAFCDQEDVCDFHTVLTSTIQQKRLTIVFNRKKDLAYFVEVNYLTKTVLKSREYGSYDRAMQCFELKRIDWCESLTLESLTLILPR